MADIDQNYSDIDKEIMDILLEASMDITEVPEQTDFSEFNVDTYMSSDCCVDNTVNSNESLTFDLNTITSYTNSEILFPQNQTLLSYNSNNVTVSQSQDDTCSNIIAKGSPNAEVTSSRVSPVTTTTASTSSRASTSPTSTTNNETIFLPPCRICGENASGFHYGANTCDACKGFFRRCIVKVERNEEEYKCLGEGNCDILPGRRNVCSACRYKKCLSVGMSKHAIKTGRYTYEKRTRDTREVQKLQGIEKPNHFAYYTKITEDEVKNIISKLVNVQRKVEPLKIYDKEFTLQKQKIILNEYKEKVELLGSLPMVSKELHDEIYNETGLDLDDRKVKMSFMAEKMDTGLKNLVQFLKALPGIDHVAIEDKAKLIKGGLSEYWFLIKHKMINPELNVVFDPVSSLGLHKEELTTILKNEEFVNEFFSTSKSFQILDLTEEEVALLKGIAITFTDRYSLDEPEKVEQIQWKLVDCLHWFINKNKRNQEHRFTKILDKLTSLRNITEIGNEINKMKSTWPVMQNYPLLLEVISDHP